MAQGESGEYMEKEKKIVESKFLGNSRIKRTERKAKREIKSK